ncbi:hypothetical protein GGI21_006760, partial [Coemansia aciculifera]
SAPKLTRVFTGVEALDDALREVYDDDADDAEDAGGAPVLELLGPSGSGKTQTLYHVCATIALPRSIAGFEAHVLFVDIDGKASPRILAQHMRDRISRATTASEADVEAIMAQALRRVHFFAPRTTQALVATLAMLPKYMHEQHTAAGALLIDGLGSNYWVDRKEAAYIRLKSKRATPFFRLQQLLVDTLQLAHQRLGCLTVAASLLFLPALDQAPKQQQQQASQGSSSGSEATGSQARVVEAQLHEYRDHMIQRWPSVVSRSFVLDSNRVDDASTLTRVTFVPIGSRQRPKQQSGSQHVPRLYKAYVDRQGLRGSP